MSAAAVGAGERPLAGTWRLVRFILRRDRVRLPVWLCSITLLVLGSVATFADTYPTAADRQARAEVLDSAAAALFVGPGYGSDDYTYGAMTANEMLPMTAIVVALMSIFLVVRHTRAEEEDGRAELLRATVVGRHATAAATLAVVGGANLLLCLLLTLGLPASLEGLDGGGSFAFAAAVAGVGLVFAAAALLVAQLTVSARAALGTSAIALGALHLLRSLGDMGGGQLSWLSPFGWATEMRAYVDERWWPLALSLTLTGALVAAALRIGARRDLGAGIVGDRPARAHGSRRLATPLGLALRLQRTSLIAWTASLFAMAVIYGSIADQASSLYEDIDALDKYLARIGNAGAIDQFLTLTMLNMVLIGTGAVIQAATRLRAEETALRAEPVLATAVGRGGWMAAQLGVALGGGVLVALAVGVGEGAAHALSAGDAGELPRLLGAALTYLPAMWIFAGVAVALFGLVPRATTWAWAVLGAIVAIGMFGPLLQLPGWLYDVSPFEHTPQLPVDGFSAVPLLALTAIAAALMAAGAAGFRRRDVG